MLDRDNIIRKIQKLLAVADGNANEHECISAALQAQRLISKYNVGSDELHNNIKDELVSFSTYKFSGKMWRGYLATIIADNFRCKAFMLNTHDGEDKFRLKHSCTFIGYKHDVQAALAVYDKCIEVGEALAKKRFKQYKAQYGHASGVKNTFLEGFCAGIQSELSKQCEALALTTPKEVLAELEKLNLVSSTWGNSEGYFDDFKEGCKRGKETIQSSRITSPDSKYYLN